MPGVFQNCYQNREAKITKSFCSGIINLLFDGFTYNTRGHFAHCSYFSSPLRARKNTTQLAKYPRVLYVKPSNKIYLLIKITLTYCFFQVIHVIQADPKGWIPKWVVNMFAVRQALNVARIKQMIEVRTLSGS